MFDIQIQMIDPFFRSRVKDRDTKKTEINDRAK